METFIQDLKHSLRMLRKSPSFTLTAVAALAFGIGANTAIFSVVNAVLLKPVALPDADRVVVFMNTSPGGAFPAASPAKFAHWRQESDIVQDVAVRRDGVLNLTGGEVPKQVKIEQVSADWFRLLGAPIALGRSFTPEEDLPGGDKVAVLSHGLWTRQFSQDPQVIGKTIFLSGDAHRVVGVMGPRFDFSELGPVPDLWLPFQLDPHSTDQGHYFVALGRLKPGVSLDQARARMAASYTEFGAKFPTTGAPGGGFGLDKLQDLLVRDVRQTLLVLLGAVGFVLLIACANVANLLLVRASGRRREIAIRAALGAGRGRIMRQLLTESVLLSMIGGAIGLGLGVLAMKALLAVNTAGLPRIGEDGALVGIDWRVALFTVGVCVVTGIIFGLLPALHSSRLDLGATLKEGGRTGTGHRGNRARSLLVITEMALALILLVGSALLIRTSMALASVEPGYDSQNVLTMRMSLTGSRFLTSASVDQMVRDGVDRLNALPGVEVASATCCVPLEGGYGLPFQVIGRPLPEGNPFHGNGGWLTVSPGYFEVFKIAVKRGRSFTARDGGGAPPVAIINESMAKEFWKDGDPLNDRIVIGKGVMAEFSTEPDRQIIGVVSDVRDGGLNKDPQPTMYIPQAQMPDAVNALNSKISPLAWVVRTKVDPMSLAHPVEEQLRQATGVPVSDIRGMSAVVSKSTSRERFNMLVMTIFGGFALLLAAIGIYGLMSYSVEQRSQEFGIRLALGAEPGEVRRMIMLQGMKLALVGVVIGVAAAFALARVISSFLFGVGAWDPVVFVSIPVVLSLVALFAVWRPALKASRTDPMSALRYE